MQSIGTLFSRLLGLVRDVALAGLWGAHWAADAFFLAFQIPNLFRNLLGEGALSMAFTPEFTRLRAEGRRAEAWRLLGRVSALLSLALAGLTALVALAALLVPWERWGADADAPRLLLTAELVALLAPFLFFICLTALWSGALQSLGHFAVPALAPVVVNVGFLAGALLLAPYWTADPAGQTRAVALCVLAGAALGAAATLAALRRRGRSDGELRSADCRLAPPPAAAFNPHSALRTPLSGHADARAATRRVLRRTAPMIAGLAVFQANVFADTVIARLCVPGDGAVTVLYFAARFMQFPLALIGTALAVAAFPALTRLAVRDDRAGLSELLAGALCRALWWVVPAAAGLALVRGPLVGLLFRHGRFSPADAARVELVLVFAAAGLIGACGAQLASRACYALGDLRRPLTVGLRLVALNLALNLVLVYTPLREAGLALSTALVAALNAALLWRTLGARLTGFPWRTVGGAAARAAAAAAVMFGAGYGLLIPGARMLGEALGFTPDSRAALLAATLAVVAGGGAVYVGIQRVLTPPAHPSQREKGTSFVEHKK